MTSDNLGPVKPELDATDDCTAEVKTYAYNSYSFDPLDFGSLISSDVIKAKFKLASQKVEFLVKQVNQNHFAGGPGEVELLRGPLTASQPMPGCQQSGL